MTRIVPIIDLSQFDGDQNTRQAFLSDLRSAARDVGFFYLSGHGIGNDQIESLFQLSRRFFALPLEDKLKIEMINSPQFRGYTRVAGERTKGLADWREQLDFGVEREAIPQSSGTPAWSRLQGPNLWPDALPELRPAILDWQEKTTATAIRLLRAFAAALEPAQTGA